MRSKRKRQGVWRPVATPPSPCPRASSSGFVSPLLPHFPNAAVSPECQSLNEAAALDSGETKEEVAMVTEATETGSSSCPESLLPGEAVVAGRAFPRHSAALPSVLLPAGFRKVTGSVVTHRAQKRDMKPVRCLHSGCIPLALSHISSLPPPPPPHFLSPISLHARKTRIRLCRRRGTAPHLRSKMSVHCSAVPGAAAQNSMTYSCSRCWGE